MELTLLKVKATHRFPSHPDIQKETPPLDMVSLRLKKKSSSKVKLLYSRPLSRTLVYMNVKITKITNVYFIRL